MADDFWGTVRAIYGRPRTETITNTFIGGNALEQDSRNGNAPLAPHANPISKLGVTSFPARLVQGTIATGAAIGVVIGAGLNANIFTSAFIGAVGAGIGSVVTSVNRNDPKEEARKLLSQVGDRYAANADLEKLTTVKEILGYLEGK